MSLDHLLIMAIVTNCDDALFLFFVCCFSFSSSSELSTLLSSLATCNFRGEAVPRFTQAKCFPKDVHSLLCEQMHT